MIHLKAECNKYSHISDIINIIRCVYLPSVCVYLVVFCLFDSPVFLLLSGSTKSGDKPKNLENIQCEAMVNHKIHVTSVN